MYSYAVLTLAGIVVTIAAAGAVYIAWSNGWGTEDSGLRWRIRAFATLGFLGGFWLSWFGMFGPVRSRGTIIVFPFVLVAIVGFSLLYSEVIVWIGKRVPKD